MGVIIFLLWYLTIGFIYWLAITNTIKANPAYQQDLDAILARMPNKQLKELAWVVAALFTMVTWPMRIIRRLINFLGG